MISSLAVTQQQALLGAFLFVVPSIILSGITAIALDAVAIPIGTKLDLPRQPVRLRRQSEFEQRQLQALCEPAEAARASNVKIDISVGDKPLDEVAFFSFAASSSISASSRGHCVGMNPLVLVSSKIAGAAVRISVAFLGGTRHEPHLLFAKQKSASAGAGALIFGGVFNSRCDLSASRKGLRQNSTVCLPRAYWV